MEENKDLMVTENEELENVEETESSNSGGAFLVGALIGAGAFALGRKVVSWIKNRKNEPKVHKTDPEVIDITPDDSEEEVEE